MRLFPWSKKRSATDLAAATAAWPLTTPLLNWGNRADPFTIGQSVEGLVIFGRTGSGKTSGSGSTVMKSYLAAGYGGLVLTVKPGELELWRAACQETGRLPHLQAFSPQSGHRFNFLAFESSRPGQGVGQTENIVSLLLEAAEVLNRGKSGGGGGGDGDNKFWNDAARGKLRNAHDALRYAGEEISITNLHRFLIDAPKTPEEVKSESFRQTSYCLQCLMKGNQLPKDAIGQHDFPNVLHYWLGSNVDLAAKTRSIIDTGLINMLDVLDRGIQRVLIGTTTTLSPEDVLNGCIVVLDLPLKEWGETGLLIQTIWKLLFQKTVERRRVEQNPRPVFLWIDEAQNFVTSGDALFQSTCRSARCATVMISQGIPGFKAALGGGEKGMSETEALLGNLTTKVFHSNGCNTTNEYASKMIGRSRQYMVNTGSSARAESDSFFGGDSNQQNNAGVSETWEYELQPNEFATLRTGGQENLGLIDAIVYRSGKLFKGSGRTWQFVNFRHAMS